MNLRSFLLAVITVFTVSSVFAQANILNAKSPSEIGVRTESQKAVDNDKPLEYGYVDDRDVLFSKMTWEKVVLDECESPSDTKYWRDEAQTHHVPKRRLEDIIVG